MKIADLLSQKKTVYTLLIVGVLVLLILNFWGFFFLRNLEDRLTAQLKEQVQTNGDLYGLQLSNEVQIDYFTALLDDDIKMVQLQRLLFDFKERGKLANIFLVDVDGKQVIDYDFRSSRALPASRFQINDSLFARTLIEQTTQVELRTFGGLYFLTAYVPVRNLYEETIAVLVFDVPAEFFTQIERFRASLLWVGLGGTVVILGFALLIILAVRRIFEFERRLHQQTRLAQLGQMAAMVAHEIRNPLSIIKGSADVLRKKYAGEQNEMFEFIPEEIDRLNRLVNDFLQFARQRELSLKKLDVNETLKKIADRFQNAAIELDLDASLPLIRADQDALTQVLLNIIENARMAIDAEGRIRIRTRYRPARPASVQIVIEDNGCGMDDETRQRIFEPFFSTRATGSGLGMAISKQLVEQMDGAIEVSSSQHTGTRVTLTFPAQVRD